MAQRTPTQEAISRAAQNTKGAGAQGEQNAPQSPDEIKKRAVDTIGTIIQTGGMISRFAQAVGIPQAAEKINAGIQSFTEAQKMISEGQVRTAPAAEAQPQGAPAPAQAGAAPAAQPPAR